MSLTIRCPDAKAMELGGVDTGSMKAYEHPIVAGIMKYRGFTDTRIACRDEDVFKFVVNATDINIFYENDLIWKLQSFIFLQKCPKVSNM